MGVKKRILAAPTARSQELRQRLADEWRRSEDNDNEPIIIEERNCSHFPTHLYVIWSDWDELTLDVRSEVIMDAYEDVRGTDEVLSVSVAMGLTPVEAKRMKIEYA